MSLTIGVPQLREDQQPSGGIPLLALMLSEERLTTNRAGGRGKPQLLRSWSVEDDGRTWVLTVRADATFQDGSPLTASDVMGTITTAWTTAAYRDVAACLPDVTGVSVRGERDVVVRLSRPCSFLLDDIDNNITRLAADGKTKVGTGPFRQVSATRDEIVLEANRRYYLGPPVIDRVVLKSYDTLRTAWAEMMRGNVDFLWEVGPDSAELLIDQSSVAVRTYLSYYVYGIALNSAKPVFRDARVRRALNFAIDRDALVQQGLRGRGVAADSLLSTDFWLRSNSAGLAAFDRRAAAGLLATAVPRPRSGARGPGAAPALSFTCLVPANFAILERLTLLVQRQLRDVGVQMRLESLPVVAINARIARGDFDAVVLPLASGPYASIPYRFWHSAGSRRRWNFWGYANAAVDRALDAMRDAQSDQQFRDALAAFEVATGNDPPAIPLAWAQTVQAVSRRFEIPAAGDGHDALYVVSRWRLREAGGEAR